MDYGNIFILTWEQWMFKNCLVGVKVNSCQFMRSDLAKQFQKFFYSTFLEKKKTKKLIFCKLIHLRLKKIRHIWGKKINQQYFPSQKFTTPNAMRVFHESLVTNNNTKNILTVCSPTKTYTSERIIIAM